MNARLPNPAISRITNSIPYLTCRYQGAIFRVPLGPNRSRIAPSGQTQPHQTRPKTQRRRDGQERRAVEQDQASRSAIDAPIACSGSRREKMLTMLKVPHHFCDVVRKKNAKSASAAVLDALAGCGSTSSPLRTTCRPIGRFVQVRDRAGRAVGDALVAVVAGRRVVRAERHRHLPLRPALDEAEHVLLGHFVAGAHAQPAQDAVLVGRCRS